LLHGKCSRCCFKQPVCICGWSGNYSRAGNGGAVSKRGIFAHRREGLQCSLAMPSALAVVCRVYRTYTSSACCTCKPLLSAPEQLDILSLKCCSSAKASVLCPNLLHAHICSLPHCTLMSCGAHLLGNAAATASSGTDAQGWPHQDVHLLHVIWHKQPCSGHA